MENIAAFELLVCLISVLCIVHAKPYTLDDAGCVNLVTMTVNGVPVPNEGHIKIKDGGQTNVVCAESSSEGTHMYWILDDKKLAGTQVPRTRKPGSERIAFNIQLSVNATKDLHLKPLRCVADHSPSNCFETTKGIIHIVQ